MKITISKKELARGLAQASAVAEKRSTQPILQNVLMRARDGQVVLVATDLVLGVRSTVPGDVEVPGDIAVGARDLFERVKAMPDGDVEVLVQGDTMTVQSGRRAFELPTIPGDDFPVLPELPRGGWLELQSPELLTAIAQVQYAIAASNDARAELRSIRFAVAGGEASLAATSGHRVSISRFGQGLGDVAPVLIPHRGIQELRRFCEEHEVVSLGIEGPWLFAHAGTSEMSVKLVEGQFPPVESALDMPSTFKATVPRQRMLEALKAVSLSAEGEGCGIVVRFEAHEVSVFVDTRKGSARDVFSAESNVPKPTEIGLNYRYMLDLLGSVGDDEVALEFSPDLQPLFLRDKRFAGIVMPMRW